MQAFNDRAQCFVEQYSNYEMFGISVSARTKSSAMVLPLIIHMDIAKDTLSDYVHITTEKCKIDACLSSICTG